MVPPSRAEAAEKKPPATAGSPLLPAPGAADEKRYAVRDIFRAHYPEYAKAHAVPPYQDKVMQALMKCGTGELGYTVSACTECPEKQIHADTCGNRNCPSCGLIAQLKWRALREGELIHGIPYYHVVFTLPHGLTDLIGQNQKTLLGLLFRSSSKSVLELCGERHGMVPGIVMVLHTCGSNMLPHYHIHMLVSGGGLTPAKDSFVRLKEGGFFLPAKLLAKRYRALFMSSLKQMHQDGGLSFTGFAKKYRNSFEWKELVDKCYGTDWNVEVKEYPPASEASGTGGRPSAPSNTAGRFADYAMEKVASPGRIRTHTCPPPDGGSKGCRVSSDGGPGVDDVCQYLAQYTNRTAITDSRILGCEDQYVTLLCKVHHRGGHTTKRPLRLEVDEFIRRFLANILPKGFAKTRFSGFLAGCVKTKNLALIRKLLGQKQPSTPVKDMKAAELVCYFYGMDFSRCPACHAKMRVLGHRLSEKQAVAKIRGSASIRAS